MDEGETAGVPLDLHEEHFQTQQFDSSLQRKQKIILIINFYLFALLATQVSSKSAMQAI